MLSDNRLVNSGRIAIALLGLGIAIGSLPAFAEVPTTEPRPLVTPVGTAQDLEGTQPRMAAEWLLGVGGEYDETTLADRPAYEQKGSPFGERFKTVNLHWRNAEQNVKRESEPFNDIRVPFVQF